MTEIIFFSDREEGDPDNGLAKPYVERDWDEIDEICSPGVDELYARYPEAFAGPTPADIIEKQHRKIYPEAFDEDASNEVTNQKLINNYLESDVLLGKKPLSVNDLMREAGDLYNGIRKVPQRREDSANHGSRARNRVSHLDVQAINDRLKNHGQIKPTNEAKIWNRYFGRVLRADRPGSSRAAVRRDLRKLVRNLDGENSDE